MAGRRPGRGQVDGSPGTDPALWGLGFYSHDKRGQAHLERLAADSVAGAAASLATYQKVLDTSPAERLAELEPAEVVGLVAAHFAPYLPAAV